jgi:hypothetical protein
MMAASDSDFTEPEADDEIDEVLEGHILDVPAREPLEEFASLQAARPLYFLVSLSLDGRTGQMRPIFGLAGCKGSASNPRHKMVVS